MTNKKLSLKSRTISTLSDAELTKIVGGVLAECTGEIIVDDGGTEYFLSIGHTCSCNKTCSRLENDTCCYGCPTPPTTA